MRNTRRVSRRGGFTLLELLAAMTMTLVIAGALATTLYMAFQAKSSAQRAVESTRQLETIARVFSHDLPNALPPTGQLAASFSGTADSVQFYTTGPEPGDAVQGDMRRVELALVDSGAGKSLVRRVTTNLLADVETVPPDEMVAGGVMSLAFSYYDGTSWTDTWESTEHSDTLPLAMQVTMEIMPPEGSGRSEPLRLVRYVAFSCGVSASVTSGGGS